MASAGEIKATVKLYNEDFKRKADESKRKIKELGNESSRSGKAVKDLGTKSNNASKGVDTLGKRAEVTEKQLKAIRRASLAVGAAVAAGIGASVKVAADFEQKMADIKSVSGATSSEMKQLSDLAVEMGAKTAFSSAGAASAIEELIKAGVSLADIINGGLEGALNLAVAGNIDLAQAAEIASTALNAFRDDNLSVAQAADILAGAANASATDVGEMQQGLAQVAAVASSAGLSFQDTATALAVMAQNGLKGSDAGTSLKTMLLNLTPSTDKAAKEMEKLGIITKDGTNRFYDASGQLKDFADVTDVLHDALDNLNPKQQAEALKEIFGTDAYRAGAIFYKDAADGINDMWDAMSKVSAADVAKTKMDTLKGSFEEFMGALETLGIQVGQEFLPTFREIVDAAADVARWFGDLNPALIKTGLESAGAAAGVALVASSVTKLYKASRLLRFTPAGAIITGISLLAGAVVAVTGAMDKDYEATLKNIQAKQDEVDQLDENIRVYEDLKDKSKLTADEMLRYMDIQSELQRTTDPKKIKALRDEMDRLREKSGLSKDELNKFLDANKKIIDASPETKRAISEEGNALAKNADAARKANREKAELLQMKTRSTFIEMLNDINKKLEREKSLTADIKELDKKRENTTKRIHDLQTKVTETDQIIDDLKGSHNQKDIIKLRNAEQINRQAKRELGREKIILENLAKQLVKKQESLTATRKDIKALDATKAQYEQIVLKQVGLNSKRGDGLKVLRKELDKLKDQKRELDEQHRLGKLGTSEYNKQVRKINDQIDRIQSAQDELREMNDIAGRTVYKDVLVSYAYRQTKLPPHIDTPIRTRHSGGPVGNIERELPKFHGGGSPALLRRPMANETDIRVLRNEMVLTEGQQANLFGILSSAAASRGVAGSLGVDMTQTNALLASIEQAIRESEGDVYFNVDGKQIEPAVSRAQGSRLSKVKRGKGGGHIV